MGEDEYLAGIPDRGEAMGDDEAGAVRHEPLQRLLYEFLRGGVDACGGLVQYEYGRVLQKRPCYADPLFFADTELNAPLADVRIISLGQTGYKIMTICGP
jgi:hypothetical protein